MTKNYIARIRESDCVGCTKCIAACPFDAIIGAQNYMHTVIAQACIGCKLCIAPCPVDCIELIELPNQTAHERQIMAKQAKERFQKRKLRLEKEAQQAREHYLAIKKHYSSN